MEAKIIETDKVTASSVGKCLGGHEVVFETTIEDNTGLMLHFDNHTPESAEFGSAVCLPEDEAFFRVTYGLETVETGTVTLRPADTNSAPVENVDGGRDE